MKCKIVLGTKQNCIAFACGLMYYWDVKTWNRMLWNEYAQSVLFTKLCQFVQLDGNSQRVFGHNLRSSGIRLVWRNRSTAVKTQPFTKWRWIVKKLSEWFFFSPSSSGACKLWEHRQCTSIPKMAHAYPLMTAWAFLNVWTDESWRVLMNQGKHWIFSPIFKYSFKKYFWEKKNVF